MIGPVRVVVVDDNDVFRAALCDVVIDDDRIELVGQAADGDRAVAVAAATKPDVVLMDLHMPGTGGTEATKRIRAAQPHVAVLILSLYDDDTAARSAGRAGARGYVPKGSRPEVIVNAVLAAAAGIQVGDI